MSQFAVYEATLEYGEEKLTAITAPSTRERAENFMREINAHHAVWISHVPRDLRVLPVPIVPTWPDTYKELLKKR